MVSKQTTIFFLIILSIALSVQAMEEQRLFPSTEVNLNKSLVAILEKVFVDDQAARQEYVEIRQKFGDDFLKLKECWETIQKNDLENLPKVTEILDHHGWLGPDTVGEQGSSTLFLVIQHADIKTQQKYLPMMREAVKNYKASGSSLALLEDRVALREGKRQIYGSQITTTNDGKMWLSPLEDPDNVDKRRAEVGLETLGQYLKRFDLKWDLVEYKKLLPEIEELEKQNRELLQNNK